MKASKKPLWKKSMLSRINYYSVMDCLDEIAENGDPYGYDREEENESGYYQEYKELFDELSAGACELLETMQEFRYGELEDVWDDMTVALLGSTHKVLGFDTVQEDYFTMISYGEDWAVEEAEKRLARLTKMELISRFRKVMTTLVLFFDIKAAHDCLTSIVEELDERGALLQCKNNEINKVYEDLTGARGVEFDALIARIPQRMWIQ